MDDLPAFFFAELFFECGHGRAESFAALADGPHQVIIPGDAAPQDPMEIGGWGIQRKGCRSIPIALLPMTGSAMTEKALFARFNGFLRRREGIAHPCIGCGNADPHGLIMAGHGAIHHAAGSSAHVFGLHSGGAETQTEH